MNRRESNFTASEIRHIRDLYCRGYNIVDLANTFRCSEDSVKAVLNTEQKHTKSKKDMADSLDKLCNKVKKIALSKNENVPPDVALWVENSIESAFAEYKEKYL